MSTVGHSQNLRQSFSILLSLATVKLPLEIITIRHNVFPVSTMVLFDLCERHLVHNILTDSANNSKRETGQSLLSSIEYYAVNQIPGRISVHSFDYWRHRKKFESVPNTPQPTNFFKYFKFRGFILHYHNTDIL